MAMACVVISPLCREGCGVGFSAMISLFFKHFLNNRIACDPKYTPSASKQLLSPVLQTAIDLKPEEQCSLKGKKYPLVNMKEKSTPHVK